jgi:hypothetical protein
MMFTQRFRLGFNTSDRKTMTPGIAIVAEVNNKTP